MRLQTILNGGFYVERREHDRSSNDSRARTRNARLASRKQKRGRSGLYKRANAAHSDEHKWKASNERQLATKTKNEAANAFLCVVKKRDREHARSRLATKKTC